MKKIIYILGILFLGIIIILNLLFTAYLDLSEHVNISFNNWMYTIGVILVALLVYILTKIIDKFLYNNGESRLKKNLRRTLFVIVIAVYIVFNVMWLLSVNPSVVGDSVHVCNLAQTFYRNDPDQFLNNETYAGVPLKQYLEAYPQQLSLSFVYSMFFRIIHFDVMEVLRILNLVGNILIVLAIYKIGSHLSKTYKTNKVLLLTLIVTFISLPLLSTFIYGDIPSLSLCLFSVYFMMKYTETKKIVYPIFASIFTMLAYLMRMNSLIFIIATVMYLLFNLIKDFRKKEIKEKILNTAIIIMYIFISIFPSTLVKNYYVEKYNLDKNKVYPNESYLLMAMEEAPRGNGWYNEPTAEAAIRNPEGIRSEYVERIKNRLGYFLQNPGYAFNFYTMKITSMWTENTYSAIRNNTSTENDPLEKYVEPLTFYQKALLILTCVCSLIVLIQNRKNLSLDVLFLITIFIGGFAFHILWEAKSRYIIPYIVVLIPVAAISINKFNIKDKLKKISLLFSKN